MERSRSEQTTQPVASVIPQNALRAREYSQVFEFIGAVARNRTADLLITNQLLYQLSYNGAKRAAHVRALGAV